MSVSSLFENGQRPNLLLIITDQERALQHWPASFAAEHLPALTRLQRHGLTLTHHFTNACMCSPSRSTLLTSQFPVVTGVTRTGSPSPPRSLPTDLPNLATVLRRAGYGRVEWHGKWHVGGTPAEYGFKGWRPPDAGNYLSVNDTLGGGQPDNDGRFLADLRRSLTECRDEGWRRRDPEPFCIVASFVNPHDVYVAQHGPAKGYTREDFSRLAVPLPPNYAEDPDVNRKPRAQGQMSARHVPFACSPQEYVNFYAHLHTVVDGRIGTLLDTLDELGLTDATLIIRTADHGEQGLSHSLVEKFYNCYQESIRVPFVVSNPVAFPKPLTSEVLSSHIDLLPTLVGLLTKEEPAHPLRIDARSWRGRDLTPVWDETHATSTVTGEKRDTSQVQSKIHFTYDDISCRGAPSLIRCIITMRHKYAVYFTPDGSDSDFELYDLTSDPLENSNLAGTPECAQLQEKMEMELHQTMVEMGTLPQGFEWPPRSTPYSIGVEQMDEKIQRTTAKKEKNLKGVQSCSGSKRIAINTTADEVLLLAAAHKRQGNAHFKDGDMEQSAGSYEEGARLLDALGGPAAAGAPALALRVALLTNLSAACHRRGEHRAAQDAASRALGVAPAHVKALYRRAVASRALGELAGAQCDLRAALAVDPGNGAVRRELAGVRKEADG